MILRGLGLLNVDLEEHLLHNKNEKISFDYLMNNITLECWDKIVYFSEEKLFPNSVDKLLNKLNLRRLADIPNAILNEKFPLVVMRLIYRFFSLAFDSSQRIQPVQTQQPINYLEQKEIDIIKNSILWIKDIRSENLYTSKYTERTALLLSALQKLEFVLSTLDIKFEKKNNIDELLHFYKDNKIYLLELFFADLHKTFKALYKDEIKKNLLEIFQKLKLKIQTYLETINQNLCDLIERDINSFCSSRLLSTNLIKDMIEDFQMGKEQKLWILVFDGMRLDTYEEIIKPELYQQFDIKKEKVYLCPLPSITDIARISLLAQKLPANWQDYYGNYTSDHNILASRGLYLSREEGKNNLRIIVASETDYGQQKLDAQNATWNILIYNLSDDWIHSCKNDIYELNSTIKDSFKRNIFQDLIQRIKEDDTVILTSDHGFIEISKENTVGIALNKGEQSNVSFRYLKNIDNKHGVKIEYGHENVYTVAKGRQSFLKEKGKISRYSHGGISMQEMAIPGVVLKKITVPTVNLELLLPEISDVIEDTEKTSKFIVKNTGNQITDFVIKIVYEEKETINSSKLSPQKSFECEFSFIPSFKINLITVKLSYKKLGNEIVSETKKIIFEVMEKKDKVQIDTSALDRFDDT